VAAVMVGVYLAARIAAAVGNRPRPAGAVAG
jgi:hypothetical protein